ncbi:exonuclease domain-containing protein [Hathewaya histolytica]|uniref:3'-5' exonuclease n=1 Tax=Hathewaya histolytica TaxID=1498 RepID=UPI003B67A7F7
MKSIFLDTETTGLRPGQIAQLTYIVEEDKQLVGIKNYFFQVDSMDIEAEKVHGFSREKLEILSEGFTFGDLSEEIQEDFYEGTIIAHNIGFDKKFLEAEFQRIFELPGYSKEFCTMEYFRNIVKIPSRNGIGYKNPKLEEVVNYYNIDKDLILDRTKMLFGCEDIGFHDARYDVMAMYMSCLKSKNRETVCSPFWNEPLEIFNK